MRDDSLPLPPPTSPAQTHDEIAAEIADHLAAAEADLTKRGIAAGEAREAARKKFGDVEKIQKTCYWIQNGETIMLRWTLIALASALCILLGLSVLGNWRSQTQLAEEMGKLSAELKTLAAAKQTPPPVPQPPEITGTIYAGSKEKTQAGAEVAILKTDGTVVRRMNCDDKGVFRSGALEPGDYCVTAPISSAPPVYSRWVAQSQPLILHAGSGNVSMALDSAFHQGGIKVSTNRDLPEFQKEGSYLVTSRLWVFVAPSRKRSHLWTSDQKTPAGWPIFCEPTQRQNGFGGFGAARSLTDQDEEGLVSFTSDYPKPQGRDATELLLNRFAKESARYPTGETEITMEVTITVLPIDEKGNVLLLTSRYQDSYLKQFIPADNKGPSFGIPGTSLEKDFGIWSSIGGGQPWLDKLSNYQAADHLRKWPPKSPRQKIDIREGQYTVLEAEIPDGIEAEIRKAIEEKPDAAKFADLVGQGLLKRPLKIASIRYEPMKK